MDLDEFLKDAKDIKPNAAFLICSDTLREHVQAGSVAKSEDSSAILFRPIHLEWIFYRKARLLSGNIVLWH